nr:RNA-directed DNA polymerase, eukaryota, reverse transcriptase zinc-binding domain protein [Tanacetum cinerariifolium]
MVYQKANVYVGESKDKKRFIIPLKYLQHPSFHTLLNLLEEEFGYDHPMGGRTFPCKDDAHVEEMCWKAHLELFPKKWVKNDRGRRTVSTTIFNDVVELGQVEEIQVKQEVIEAIVDTGSEKNLISSSLVERLGLETTPHPRPYSLSPNLWERDAVYYRRAQKYEIEKDGKKYIVNKSNITKDDELVKAFQARRTTCPMRPEQKDLTDLSSLLSHLRLLEVHDVWECTVDKTRSFTVKGMRSHIMNQSTVTGLTPFRWNRILPIKVNTLCWRIINLRLPTRLNLDYRGVDLDSVRCPICDNDIENEEHLFVHCDISINT